MRMLKIGASLTTLSQFRATKKLSKRKLSSIIRRIYQMFRTTWYLLEGGIEIAIMAGLMPTLID